MKHLTSTRSNVLLVPFSFLVLLAQSSCGSSARPAPELIVRASEFTYSENPIRVPVGKPVRIVLSNTGAIEHDLVVRGVPATNVRAMTGGHGHGSDVAAHAPAGARAWVEFTPTKAGTYEVDCTLPGHKDAGMKTVLLVE